LNLFYKPDVLGEIIKDDVSDDNIFLFQDFFLSHNIIADLYNGALNIMRKAIGDGFLGNLINSGCVFQPIRVNLV